MRNILIALLLIPFVVTPAAAKGLTGTLQKIDKSGTINVGYRQDKPPMSFLDENSGPDGYSIDICEEIVADIGKRLGKKIEIKFLEVSVEERFAALGDGRIDLLCGATTRTISRGEIVDFSQLTFVTGASFMTLKSNDIRGDFTGKKIGVLQGTTTEKALKELFDESKTAAEIVRFKSTVEGFSSLIKGEIDAYSADQVVLIGLALSSGSPNKFAVLPDLFSYEPYALAIRRNDSDFRLAVDRVISDLYRSKKIQTIYDKWIGDFIGRTSAYEALIKLNSIPE